MVILLWAERGEATHGRTTLVSHTVTCSASMGHMGTFRVHVCFKCIFRMSWLKFFSYTHIYVCAHTHMPQHARAGQGQLPGIGSLLPPVSWGLNSVYQAWQRAALPIDPSCWLACMPYNTS